MKSSHFIETVASAGLSSFDTEFGVEAPSMKILPTSPRSSLTVLPRPELSPTAPRMCSVTVVRSICVSPKSKIEAQA
ncbi:hypothetical protein D3C81_2094860 [compost metagenome]